MSNNQKEKRPNWYHPLARARYDGSMRTYGEIQARVLPKEMAEEYDVDIPVTWKEQPALYLLRGLGLGKKGLPPGTGFGLVQSPYSDIYTKIYGVNPIADLPKYRKMYRSHPDIQQAIQMQVNLAVGKGFTIAHDDEDVIEYLIKAVNRLNLPQHMLTMGTDMLTYGNSFTEIQWDKSVSKKEQIYDYQGTEYTIKDLKSLNIPMKNVKPAVFDDGNTKKNFIAQTLEKSNEAKNIVALKDLDPCFTPNNIVIMDDLSPKNISEIKEGESVLTHKGKEQKVTKVFERNYSGKILKIKLHKYSENLESTPNHPFLVIPKEKWKQHLTACSNERKEFKKYNSGKRKRYPKYNNSKIPEAKWILAQDLKPGDMILYPIKHSHEGLSSIKFYDYAEPLKQLHKNYHKIGISDLPITPELLSLFGYYLSEGSTNKNTTHFDFHIKEINFASEVKENLKKVFGVNATERESKHRQGRTIYIVSKEISSFFRNLLGRGSREKHLPKFLINGLSKEQLKILFEKYCNGDGNKTFVYENRRSLGFSSRSIKLSYQMRDIALLLGHHPGLGYHKAKDGIDYSVSMYEAYRRLSKNDGNYIYHRIENITEKDYFGKVYNLEVENDNSYCIGYATVHNCYMRVRRDSYGNIFGMIQWMAFPPVLIDNESCIHIKYRPNSVGYESAYGCSILMPIIKNTDLLNQFENDAATWIHSRAVPPLIVKGGSEEKPYSTIQMESLMSALKTRTAATMIFTKGDVNFEELKTIASDLNLDWWLKYLLLRRYQSLGVPPIFMGLTERGSKGTAEVLLHDFVTRLQVLQEFISDPIEEYIFKPLIKARFGEDTEDAEIVWKPIIEEDKNMRSQRLIQMLQAGACTVNEIREEMGFRRMSEDKYDELQPPQEPAAFGKGVPPKPGATPAKAPELNRVTQQNKKPPEGHMKLEDLKSKKIQLLQLDEAFRVKMLDLTRKTKFDLKDDGKLVKQVKHEATTEAQDIINEHVVASYLVGRLNANGALGKEDDLSLKQEDLESLANLKETCIGDFDKILEDMVKSKEEGKLE